MLKRLSVVLVLALFVIAAVPAAAQEPPAQPLSEQAVEAAKLREQADRWNTVSNWGLNVAMASALIGIVYSEALENNPQADRAVVYGAGGGMATWAIGKPDLPHVRSAGPRTARGHRRPAARRCCRASGGGRRGLKGLEPSCVCLAISRSATLSRPHPIS